MKKLFALSLISILYMPLHAQEEVDYKYNTVKNYYSYLSIDGVLYITDKSNGKEYPYILVRYPSEKTNSTFEIPETVRHIVPHAFKGNKYLKTIISQAVFLQAVMTTMPSRFQHLPLMIPPSRNSSQGGLRLQFPLLG